MPYLVAVVLGYLVGSCNAAYYVTRWLSHADIRRLGSGNVGALNVYYHLGLRAALPVGLWDVGKGVLAAGVAWAAGGNTVAVVAGLAAVVGHCFPLFLRFQGGKGVATSMGVLLVLGFPHSWLILIIFAGVLLAIRRTAFAAGVALPFAPLLLWWGHFPVPTILLSLALIVLLVSRQAPDTLRDLDIHLKRDRSTQPGSPSGSPAILHDAREHHE